MVVTPDPYSSCLAKWGDAVSDRVFLECVIEAEHETTNTYIRSIALVLAGVLVFSMQTGFAMLCAGCVRKKNVQNTLLKNLLDACGASIAFFSVGYAFAFGNTTAIDAPTTKSFMGTTNFFLVGVEDLSFWFFQYVFSAAAVTIIAGTLAERCQMIAYLCYSLLLSGWVYPIIVHAIWSSRGFLSASAVDPLFGVGMVDFAGSGVVHLTGGTTALFAAIILGPRRGRFHDESGRRLEKPREFPGSSFALQMLGTLVLWFGWYGFNGGSALLTRKPNFHEAMALAATNTTLSGGAAGISALMINLWYLERYTGEAYFDVKKAMNGSLAGLVAITGSCGVVEPFAAVIIGTIAGVVYLLSSHLLIKLRIDDACDAIPVHAFAGLWGVIAVGLFASPKRLSEFYSHGKHPGLFYSWYLGDSNFHLLGAQIVGALFIMGWVVAIMLPFFVWLDWKGWLRSDPLEELVGLDTSYHGGLALLSTHNDVKPEYISAYKERQIENHSLRQLKQEKRYRGENGSAKTSSVNHSVKEEEEIEDEEVDQLNGETEGDFGSKIAL